jgi:hypothetical protein
MKPLDVNNFNTGPRLTLTFAVLIVLILGGNGLIWWQFRIASLQTNRLAGESQQLIVVLRLQESILYFISGWMNSHGQRTRTAWLPKLSRCVEFSLNRLTEQGTTSLICRPKLV